MQLHGVNRVAVCVHFLVTHAAERRVEDNGEDIYRHAADVDKPAEGLGQFDVQLFCKGKYVVKVEVFKQKDGTRFVIGVRVDVKTAGDPVLVRHVKAYQALVLRHVADHKSQVVIVFSLTRRAAFDVGLEVYRILRAASGGFVRNGERG